MADTRRPRWIHFEDAPVGEAEKDRFAEFRKPLADETVRGRPGSAFFFPPGAANRPFDGSDETARLATMRSGEGGRTVLD